MRKKPNAEKTAPDGAATASRRGILGGLGAVAAASLGGPALAQDGKWWESLPGFGSPSGRQPKTQAAARIEEELSDLRVGQTPLRSDAMVQYIDKAITRYERLVERGGWPAIPRGRTLRPGESDERVSVLRQRLAMSGDHRDRSTSSGWGDSYEYDGHIEQAVRTYQQRHGLNVNGRVDLPTLGQLNITAGARLEQLRLNRRRIETLLNSRVEERYILVNVAGFQLEAVENWEVVRRHRVIAGKPDRQTPEIHATVRALNFFPYWRVPKSVAVLDLIPRLQREPDYLTKEHIRVFNGYGGPELDSMQIDWTTADGNKLWFRQDPGPHNALGLVRIDMPNSDIVYMHDTPMKPLFRQRGRAFSAGCVRVENVMQLAEWIARHEQGWDRPGTTDAVIEAGQALDVTLTRPIPVYFTYITAWADEEGIAEFRPDVYGRDGNREFAGLRDPDAPPPPSGGLAP